MREGCVFSDRILAVAGCLCRGPSVWSQQVQYLGDFLGKKTKASHLPPQTVWEYVR